MEKRDYILRQIDQLGRVLAKLLSDLTGLKNQGQTSKAIEITNQVLQEELNFDIEDLIAIPTNELIYTLQSDKKFSINNIEKIADIFLFVADHTFDEEDQNERRKKLYTKSLKIYEYIEKTEDIYSFDRHLKIERIKERFNKI